MNALSRALARVEDVVATWFEDLVLAIHRPEELTERTAWCVPCRTRWPCEPVVRTLDARDARRNR